MDNVEIQKNKLITGISRIMTKLVDGKVVVE